MRRQVLKNFIVDRKGLTLTELIVASTLMGIVMVGVAGFSMNTKNLHSASSKSNILAIRTSAALKLIQEDASLAIGDATDSGIRTRASGSRRKICFRHDVNGTPDNYGDDNWMCYCHTGDSILRQWANGAPNNNACPAGGGLQLIELNQIDFFNVVPDDTSPEYVEITIQACYDPSVACHPVNNPQKTMNTRVVPASHSSG